MRRPLILLLIAMIAGILAGSYWIIPFYSLCAAAVVTLILILVSLRKKWLPAGFVFIFLAVFLLGFFNIQKAFHFPESRPHILSYANEGKITVEGFVSESPVAYADKNVLIVQPLRILKDKTYRPVFGAVRLSIPSGLTFYLGDFIRFQSSLRKIENFNNPGALNYKRLMNLQGIYISGYIHDASDIILLRKQPSFGVHRMIESFRLYLKRIIGNHAPMPEKSIIEAMTLGNQNEIPSVIRDNFSKTGTSHILSISGLHVGMVAASFFVLIFLILKSSEYLMLKFQHRQNCGRIFFRDRPAVCRYRGHGGYGNAGDVHGIRFSARADLRKAKRSLQYLGDCRSDDSGGCARSAF